MRSDNVVYSEKESSPRLNSFVIATTMYPKWDLFICLIPQQFLIPENIREKTLGIYSIAEYR